jgi:hypothetical protein
MEDCIRNGSACAGDANFANTACTHGIKLSVRDIEGGARIKRELLLFSVTVTLLPIGKPMTAPPVRRPAVATICHNLQSAYMRVLKQNDLTTFQLKNSRECNPTKE